jgi:hypothetical protein
MPQVNIFRWQAGNGWLVLSGGGAHDSSDVLDIEAHTLRRTVSQGPLAYIWAAGDIETADRHMDSLRELGARTGYLVDVLAEADDTLSRRLREAGMIILGDGPRVDTLRDALDGVVLDSMAEAFQRGATVYAAGSSTMAFGEHMPDGAGTNWLQGSIIVPGYTAEAADQLHERVQAHPRSYGLGLGAGAALALGPRGEVEVWGNESITVALGQDLQPD